MRLGREPVRSESRNVRGPIERAFAIALACVLIACSSGCVYEATSVRLVITTTVAAGRPMIIRTLVVRGTNPNLDALDLRTDWTEFTALVGEVARDGGVDAGATDAGHVDAGRHATLPVTLGIVPHSGDPLNEVVTVVIEGRVDPGTFTEVTIRRVISFHFVVHETLSYSVTLSDFCLTPDIGCRAAICTTQTLCEEGGQTCGNDGTCADIGVALNPVDGGLCNPHNVLCNNACVDLSNDFFNCGACGHRCPGFNFCSGGMCSCAGMTCAGACVDTYGDPANCGLCGNRCATGTTCNNGVCR